MGMKAWNKYLSTHQNALNHGKVPNVLVTKLKNTAWFGLEEHDLSTHKVYRDVVWCPLKYIVRLTLNTEKWWKYPCKGIVNKTRITLCYTDWILDSCPCEYPLFSRRIREFLTCCICLIEYSLNKSGTLPLLGSELEPNPQPLLETQPRYFASWDNGPCQL